MKFLSVQELLFIHSALIEETGGSDGLRDLGLLESAAASPKHSFGDQDLYPTLIDKAAALMFSLIKNHPFIDGNKRIAVSAAGIFLEANGFMLVAEKQSLVEFTLGIASRKSTVQDIAAWLHQNTQPIRRLKK